MKKLLLFLSIVIMGVLPSLAQEDEPNCKDHPLFTRMVEYYIEKCEEKKFNSYQFIDPETKKEVIVEGKYYLTIYKIKEEFEGKKSALQVARNYTNAIQKIGGSFYMTNPSGDDKTYMKVKKEDKEIWVSLEQGWDGDYYYLYIVEKGSMKQELIADAKSLFSVIKEKGSVSVYGIYFDFNKADIKPESESAIKEIAKLLQENKGLKLYVVGHTDNVGTIDYNMKLSKQRADAVLNELVTKYKIQSSRLSSYGVGSLCPIVSNKT